MEVHCRSRAGARKLRLFNAFVYAEYTEPGLVVFYVFLGACCVVAVEII